VLAKWDTPSFDEATRTVLAARLNDVPPRRFLTEAEWALVEALCARLLPQPDRARPIPITPWIDAMLFDGRGEGFRRPDMPPMQEAWRTGLAAIDAEARQRHDRRFIDLGAPEQEALLHALADGKAAPSLWHGVDACRFFTHLLLKSIVGIYYAHPDAWSEIGFGGPASPRGYVRLGLDTRDAWEAKEAR
jgi:hypothetical protein